MIVLGEVFFQELINYAKLHSPKECCGYFFGFRDTSNNQNIVKQIFKMNNIHENPKDFFMFSPQEQLDALIKCKKENLEIIGIFHSHPHSKAYPSNEDMKYIYDHRHSYTIISLLEKIPQVKSFRIKETEICEETIKI
ncbi:M67 family metallopeptidase [Helicobacter cappadocius]|uniref:M67 family metallopeptidase n=1 Tax=Helicobacter cappadocius TaxID=3063998 RepID=A0AA90T4Q3_9HELI|nr:MULTISPECIES: M67 family metallopeptidase [unclassified Helicobacter]MDO7252730.1 M67 family metallopeptidase [Helicobacter sp. faydin-H75]MDP2538598.1 M67 family metallopeptidase [Helicobacter sp. faydin-H76]